MLRSQRGWKVAKREFLMLAHEYRAARDGPGGYFMSEKLDGQRCFWDGGISRGIPKSEIPWANTAKDARYKTSPVATGLWSRYSNVIHAPDYWLDALPLIPLDGELFIGRNRRQQLMSIVKKLIPGPGWAKVKFNIFGMVPLETVFADGEIRNPNFHKVIDSRACVDLIDDSNLTYYPKPETVFHTTVHLMNKYCQTGVVVHYQQQLPFATNSARVTIENHLEYISEQGGEGLILRNPINIWKPERTYELLKVKKLDDAEGRVTGYTTGRETDKGSRLLGKMGALIVEYNGKRLELSGFKDQERRLFLRSGDNDWVYDEILGKTWAAEHPGEDCPEHVTNRLFPIGSVVSFKYRGKSDDGIPQEARYWRPGD